MALPVVSPDGRHPIAKHAPRRASIAQVRRSIPVEQYLVILHHAAITGEMPIIDPATGVQKRDADNNPLYDILSTKDRMSVLQDLMDRAMPKVKAVEMAVNDQRSMVDFTQASEEELRQLASEDAEEEDPLTQMLRTVSDAEFEAIGEEDD